MATTTDSKNTLSRDCGKCKKTLPLELFKALDNPHKFYVYGECKNCINCRNHINALRKLRELRKAEKERNETCDCCAKPYLEECHCWCSECGREMSRCRYTCSFYTK